MQTCEPDNNITEAFAKQIIKEHFYEQRQTQDDDVSTIINKAKEIYGRDAVARIFKEAYDERN